MKFFEHVDAIVGARDRVICGPQRNLTGEEMARFENEVYNRTLNKSEQQFVVGLCFLTQYALAHREAGFDTIEKAHGQTTVEWELEYTNDRHQRLVATAGAFEFEEV